MCHTAFPALFTVCLLRVLYGVLWIGQTFASQNDVICQYISNCLATALTKTACSVIFGEGLVNGPKTWLLTDWLVKFPVICFLREVTRSTPWTSYFLYCPTIITLTLFVFVHHSPFCLCFLFQLKDKQRQMIKDKFKVRME